MRCAAVGAKFSDSEVNAIRGEQHHAACAIAQQSGSSGYVNCHVPGVKAEN